MASPQAENGFIQIATGKDENDILKALIRAELSGTEYQIVLVVLRQTYGYKKKEDWISLSQFEKITNKSRKGICESINKLVKNNILVKNSTPGKNAYFSFNKDFDTWNKLVKKSGLVKKSSRTSVLLPPQLVKKTTHTKDNTKETITKENISKEIDKSGYGNENINLVIKSLEDQLGGSLDGGIRVNRNYANLLLKRFKKDYPDKNEVELVTTLIRYALLDDFHAKNISGFKYLFYNAQKIIQATKNKATKSPKILKI